MNVDFPYTTVAECIEAGIAKKIAVPPGETIFCANLDCKIATFTAWIYNSSTFVFENGRLLVRPVTLWFPLCSRHAPLQEAPKEAPDVAERSKS